MGLVEVRGVGRGEGEGRGWRIRRDEGWESLIKFYGGCSVAHPAEGEGSFLFTPFPPLLLSGKYEVVFMITINKCIFFPHFHSFVNLESVGRGRYTRKTISIF